MVKSINGSYIRSISHNQHEILYNIMQMHNNGEAFEADITFSKGKFYGNFKIKADDDKIYEIEIPKPKYRLDVAPQQEDTIKIEPDGALPFEDNSIKSIVFDPPFVISCGPSMKLGDFDENGKKRVSNCISRRFSAYYPVNQLLTSYHHWMKEIKRVLKPDGIAVVKCQKTVTGSKMLNSPEYLWFLGECLGLDMIDSFCLLSKGRLISGKVKNQQHSRRFECHFHVFKNSLKKKITYLDFLPDEMIDDLLNNLKQNNISKKRKS